MNEVRPSSNSLSFKYPLSATAQSAEASRPHSSPQAPVTGSANGTLVLKNGQGQRGSSILDALAPIGAFFTAKAQQVDWHRRLALSNIAGAWEEEFALIKHALHALPPPRYFHDFVSKNKDVRVKAYLEAYGPGSRRNLGVYLTDPTLSDLAQQLVRDPKKPTALIAMRCAIYRVFGEEIGEELRVKARTFCSDGLNMLKPEAYKRHYTGYILRDNYLNSAATGHQHSKLENYIEGEVDRVAAVFQPISICLENDEIRNRLADVHESYFKPDFEGDVVNKKKSTARTRSGFEQFKRAIILMTLGPLWCLGMGLQALAYRIFRLKALIALKVRSIDHFSR